jgi:micrococcal nuclease
MKTNEKNLTHVSKVLVLAVLVALSPLLKKLNVDFKTPNTESQNSRALVKAPPVSKVLSEIKGGKVGGFRVVRVVDGDTLVVEKNQEELKVRLIGVNAPESVDPRKSVECFGKESSSHLKSLATHYEVLLEIDPSQDLTDKYRRVLAYVYRSDGVFLNELMIQHGYAYEYTYDKPYKFQKDFKLAEKNAKLRGLGLWADEACGLKNIK